MSVRNRLPESVLVLKSSPFLDSSGMYVVIETFNVRLCDESLNEHWFL